LSFFHIFLIISHFNLISSIFTISYYYSTCISSMFSVSFHYSTCFSSVFP
jgi:hypothetical protein